MRPARLMVLAPVLGVAACGGGGPMGMSPSPSRPQVAVADEVAAVDRSMLVGTWRCRELNPYPDQPEMTQRLTLERDGTMRSVASVPMGEQMPGGGTLQVSAQGRWDAADGGIVTRDVEVSSEMVGGNAAMSAMMGMVNRMSNAMVDRTTPGNADVLRLGDDAMTLKGEGDDAPVLACERA